MEVATFAGGCFWRMQSIFSKVPGVVSTVVGYAGGNTAQSNLSSSSYTNNWPC